MADTTSDPSGGGGGADSFAELLAPTLPQTIVGLIRLQGMAQERGLTAFHEGMIELVDGLLKEVNLTAAAIAKEADALIVARIFATHAANRPAGDNTLESHIVSRPGPMGLVKVALTEELNKVVNQRGRYGPYWRAQEFGTGSDKVPSQEGRILFGTFEPSGEPPDAAQRGLGAGHDLAFIPFGTAPGFGRISVELPARHFLTDGANAAGAAYVERMLSIERKYVKMGDDLLKALAAQRTTGARTFRGRIEG